MGHPAPPNSTSSLAPLSLWKTQRLDVLAWILALKAALLACVYALAVRAPGLFQVENYQANLHWSEGPPGVADWFSTWDGMHYLYLSEHGYVPGHPTTAFYPLWPLLIRCVSTLLGSHTLIAALLASNLSSACALWLMYRLVREQGGSSPAASTILLLFYPGALFFMFPYTESLYLLLSVGLFYLLLQGHDRGAAAAIFLLTLTRAVGVFGAVPLAYQLVIQRNAEGKRRIFREGWLLLAAPAALVLQFSVMYLFTGDAFTGVRVQRGFAALASVARFLEPLRFAHAYLDVRALHGFEYSLLDRLWFTLALALLPLVYRISRPMFWYTLAVGSFSAVTTDFISFTRYCSVLFPVFIAAGNLLTRKWTKLVLLLVVLSFVLLQLVFVFHHVRFLWVG